MPRRTFQELGGTPLSLVYIAGNLVEAEAVERALTDRGMDYALSLEPFVNVTMTSLILGSEHAGLFVYVPTTQHRFCREILEGSGLKDTLGLEWTPQPESSHGA